MSDSPPPGVDVVFAPWTPEQVDALNFWQGLGAEPPMYHDDPVVGRLVLIATREGWVAHHPGPVVRIWAPRFMLAARPSLPSTPAVAERKEGFAVALLSP
ncbi:MAG: hypothetical protein KGJ23_14645 [Euryarchaeota archaeon]|nr:hypothetical protein [Euryarchaeota archaeon]MDE1837839.1 hypothetical protein [Euryarchaeota archaeon]MDE1880113.1 hypothetical protein [Euryarchaeota archaeon]MDE2046767.1 hypothetical protein [Thermoplasmata archaeon]